MSHHSRNEDRRHSSSRRDDSQSSRGSRRDRDRDYGRRSSPGPSRGRSPPPPVAIRDLNELPLEFGRPLEPLTHEDENTVLRRMKTAFSNSPLIVIYQCVAQNKKIKVWTRNFKEVRGLFAGFIIAFDKHWNLILSDCEELYIKPKKAKAPFLDKVDSDDIPDLPPKQPRVKKPKEPVEAVEGAESNSECVAEDAPSNPEGTEPEDSKNGKKKKKRKGKGKVRMIHKRNIQTVFLRGDNIVMLSIMDSNDKIILG